MAMVHSSARSNSASPWKAHTVAAIEECGADGIQLPGQRCHGGFIQDGEPLLEMSQEDEDTSLGVPPMDPDGRSAQPRPDVDG
jgi:hypothetical protein